MIWIKKEKIVATVADFYLDTIALGLTKAGKEVKAIYEWDEMQYQPGDRVVVIGATRAMELWGKKIPYYYWAQGIWPEESYLRYGSRVRQWAQSKLEKRALKQAEFVFFVSDAMKKHFEKKYKLQFDGKCYIMPCANEQLHSEAFSTPGKYENNVFCYAGGLSQWQCFDETVALYAKIEAARPDSRLLLLVKEKDQALQMLQKYAVKNYSIDYVPIEQLPQALSQAKFGFVIRSASPINAVATPTKIVTYLCNGLIPIYSHTLSGIREMLAGAKTPICYQNDGDITKILSVMDRDLPAKEVQSDLEAVYQKAYRRQRHVEQIAAHFQAQLGR